MLITPSEHGIATHFIPSRRVPMLLENVSTLEKPTFAQINDIIEENSSESEHLGTMASALVGPVRVALDFAFRHNKVEDIVTDLDALVEHRDPAISKWASRTLESLNLRSPTSLKVALRAIRRGKEKSVIEALEMEYAIAAALCVGPLVVYCLLLRHIQLMSCRMAQVLILRLESNSS